MTCVAAMRNMTAAMKGRNALENAGVRCDIVSLEPSLTKNGCAYGLNFECRDRGRVKRILTAKKVSYGEILGDREARY